MLPVINSSLWTLTTPINSLKQAGFVASIIFFFNPAAFCLCVHVKGMV